MIDTGSDESDLILVSDKDARKVGIKIEGLPTKFPDKIEIEDQKGVTVEKSRSTENESVEESDPDLFNLLEKISKNEVKMELQEDELQEDIGMFMKWSENKLLNNPWSPQPVQQDNKTGSLFTKLNDVRQDWFMQPEIENKIEFVELKSRIRSKSDD